MGDDRPTRHGSRKGWLLFAAAIVFLVSLTLLEKIGKPERQPAADRPAPVLPEVVRADDGAIEIRYDTFRRDTIRLDDEEKAAELFDCLVHGIEGKFPEGGAGWDRQGIREATRVIRTECLARVDSLPVPG